MLKNAGGADTRPFDGEATRACQTASSAKLSKSAAKKQFIHSWVGLWQGNFKARAGCHDVTDFLPFLKRFYSGGGYMVDVGANVGSTTMEIVGTFHAAEERVFRAQSKVKSVCTDTMSAVPPVLSIEASPRCATGCLPLVQAQPSSKWFCGQTPCGDEKSHPFSHLCWKLAWKAWKGFNRAPGENWL